MSNKISNEDKIKDIVAEQLSVDREKVVPAAEWDDLGADSLDRVELIMAMEEEFYIEVADEVAEKITNVAELVNYINEITGTV